MLFSYFLTSRPIVCLTEYCEKYAKPEDIGATTEEKSSDEELSDEEAYASSDEAVPGHLEP